MVTFVWSNLPRTLRPDPVISEGRLSVWRSVLRFLSGVLVIAYPRPRRRRVRRNAVVGENQGSKGRYGGQGLVPHGAGGDDPRAQARFAGGSLGAPRYTVAVRQGGDKSSQTYRQRVI